MTDPEEMRARAEREMGLRRGNLCATDVLALLAECERLRAAWLLVERYCERYPSDWRLVFQRGNETLEVSVPEDVWRAFDGCAQGGRR